jgi:hypothetical protein
MPTEHRPAIWHVSCQGPYLLNARANCAIPRFQHDDRDSPYSNIARTTAPPMTRESMNSLSRVGFETFVFYAPLNRCLTVMTLWIPLLQRKALLFRWRDVPLSYDGVYLLMDVKRDSRLLKKCFSLGSTDPRRSCNSLPPSPAARFHSLSTIVDCLSFICPSQA